MILKPKGQSWSNSIDWFFSCVKIFNQCERKISINVSEKFQSMSEIFQSMLENFLSMRGNFLSMRENFQSMSENFPSMWVKNFSQCSKNFSRYRKNCHKTIFNINLNYSFINYTNLIFRTFVPLKRRFCHFGCIKKQRNVLKFQNVSSTICIKWKQERTERLWRLRKR